MRAIRLSATLAGALFALVALPTTAAGASTTVRASASASAALPPAWIALYGTPGDAITPPSGSHLFSQTATTRITAGASSTAVGLDIYGDFSYSFEFAPPAGDSLAVGSYTDADRLVSRRPGYPGMDISGEAIGCNIVSGQFAINDIGFVNGALDRLDVTFLQHCEGGFGAIFGEASYNEPVAGPLLLQAASLRLPPQYLGTGRDLPVWVSNPGSSPVTVATPTVTQVPGSAALDTSVTGDTCPAVLAGGATCTMTVRVAPTVPASSEATVTIASGTTAETVTVDDSGVAGAAAFSLDGDQGEYITGGGQLTLNQFNATVSAVDPASFGQNTTGTVNLIAITPVSATAFHTLTATVAAPTGQRLAVGFYPNARSGATATQPGLNIVADGRSCATEPTSNSPPPEVSGQFTVREIAYDSNGYLSRFAADAVLHCPAGGPPIYASFRTLSTVGYSTVSVQPFSDQRFDLQLIGTSSASRTITVTNTGDQPQAISPTITGDAPGDYPLTSTCDAHHLVAAGASCTLTIAFAPVGVEDRPASLVITDGTRRGSQVIGLDGHGASVPWLTYPYDGQNDVYTSHPFTWLTLPDAQANVLIVGTHEGGTDLVNTGVLPGSQTSIQVPALPSNIGLYAYVFSEINGHWQHSPPVTFYLTPQIAAFTTPTDGWAGLEPIQVFTWVNNVESGGYDVIVGTKPGSKNLADSGVLPATAFSYNPPLLPTGVRLYATLFTNWGGHWNFSNSISFTYLEGGKLTSPINGQVAVTPATSYTWAPFATAQAYWLVVGTTGGGANVVNAGPMSPEQTTYPGVALPKGKTLYVTLFTEIGGSWAHSDSILFFSA